MEHTVYLWTAIIGCTLLLIQVVLQVIGLGDIDVDGVDADVDVDGADPHGDASGHGNLFFGLLSFKTIVAFLGFFGLTGLTLEPTELLPAHRILLACLAGFAAMFMVGYLMRALHGLGSSGTVDLTRAVGHTAVVYLRVPAAGEGRGKITVELQGRTVELTAVTSGEALATGTAVKIIEFLGGETVKVVPVK